MSLGRQLFENKESRKAKALELSELWDSNEKCMGEQAAYEISCQQLSIDPDEGYDLLALLNEG